MRYLKPALSCILLASIAVSGRAEECPDAPKMLHEQVLEGMSAGANAVLEGAESALAGAGKVLDQVTGVNEDDLPARQFIEAYRNSRASKCLQKIALNPKSGGRTYAQALATQVPGSKVPDAYRCFHFVKQDLKDMGFPAALVDAMGEYPLYRGTHSLQPARSLEAMGWVNLLARTPDGRFANPDLAKLLQDRRNLNRLGSAYVAYEWNGLPVYALNEDGVEERVPDEVVAPGHGAFIVDEGEAHAYHSRHPILSTFTHQAPLEIWVMKQPTRERYAHACDAPASGSAAAAPRAARRRTASRR